MRILVTNDDGIHAPGLEIMESLARQFAGPDGTVWTVAPEQEQSGVGHAITFQNVLQVQQVGQRRFMVQGTPGDCVIVALRHLMAKPPDLVLSGVNRGNNSGQNAAYSGTVGAAMEGALQGVRSIAYSQYIGLKNRLLDDPFEATRTHGLILLRKLIDCTPWDEQDYRLFVNVNFPPCPADEVAGASVVSQGFRRNSNYSIEPLLTRARRRFLSIAGGLQTCTATPGTDVNANMADQISITPMRADMTAYETMENMRERFRKRELC